MNGIGIASLQPHRFAYDIVASRLILSDDVSMLRLNHKIFRSFKRRMMHQGIRKLF